MTRALSTSAGSTLLAAFLVIACGDGGPGPSYGTPSDQTNPAPYTQNPPLNQGQTAAINPQTSPPIDSQSSPAPTGGSSVPDPGTGTGSGDICNTLCKFVLCANDASLGACVSSCVAEGGLDSAPCLREAVSAFQCVEQAGFSFCALTKDLNSRPMSLPAQAIPGEQCNAEADAYTRCQSRNNPPDPVVNEPPNQGGAPATLPF